MIPVSKFSSRLGERVRLVVIHTSEGARDVDSLAAFLNRPGVHASYHGAVDDTRFEQYVDYTQAAWALRNGNQESDNLCLCGFASWSRAEWLRHPRMLELTAAWITQRCLARDLPVRRLTDPEVGQVMRNPHHPGGWTDHHGYTVGTGDGTHWDVGENFPFEAVAHRADELTRRQGVLMALTDTEQTELLSRVRSLDIQIGGDLDAAGPDPEGWPARRYGVSAQPNLTVAAGIGEIDRELNSRLGLHGRPGPDKDTLAGHVLSLRAEVLALAQQVTAIAAALASSTPEI